MARARSIARASRYVTVEVEVDIAAYLSETTDEELHDLDLHRESNCDAEQDEQAAEALYAAINALHQQAHTDQPLFADACLREPCRSLPLRQHPGLSATPGTY
jgi:hypothetical protein